MKLYLKQQRFFAIGYTVLLQIAALLAIAYWPELRDQIDLIMKLVPIEGAQRFFIAFQEQGYWAYLDAQLLIKGAGLFGGMAACLLGSGVIAREVDQGTICFLLARPISRRQLLLERWFAGIAILLAPLFLASFVSWLASPHVDESIQLGLLMASTAHTGLFAIAVYSATIWFSTFCAQQLKAGLIMMGLLFLQMAIYVIKDIWHFSAFNLIDLDVLLPLANEGVYPWNETAILMTASMSFIGLAYRRFQKSSY